MEDRKVINILSKLSIFCRLLMVLTFLIFTYLGGFRPDQIVELVQIVTPMTVLYLTVFIIRLIRKPFPVPQFEINLSTVYIIRTPVFIVYIIQLLGICLGALLPNILSFDKLSMVLFFTEIFFAIYAATVIGYLFSSHQ